MSNLTLTWDDLRDRACNHNDLSAEKKIEAVAAFDFLQSNFRDSFFCIEHPLFAFFIDRSGWRCEWAIWFARLLQSLKQHPDFPRLVRELGNPVLYSERMSILRIIEILAPNGFSFSLDSPITIGTVVKKPDLFIKYGNLDSGFFIEVTTLSPHQKQREADEVFRQLTDSLMRFHFLLNCSGRLERVLAPLHLQEVLQKIQSSAEKAANKTGFETIEIPGVIHFAFAVKSRMSDLQAWAEVQNMKVGEISGPSVNIEEFDRIAFKMKNELKQVPKDRANVVVIYSHIFTMPPMESTQFEKFVHALEDEVYKHSHIGHLVLIFRWTGSNENRIFRYNDHICINRCRLYFNCDSILIFKNRFAVQPMPSDVEEQFLNSFTTLR